MVVDNSEDAIHAKEAEPVFSSTPIYDLSGKKINCHLSTVNSQLKKGLYIQNGKKVAVKWETVEHYSHFRAWASYTEGQGGGEVIFFTLAL